jgi:hypothetical protein
MAHIVITLKDGTVKDFPNQSRPGGSWTNSVRYEGAFVIVKDVWGKETAYPAADVKQVENTPEVRGW